MGQDIHIRIVKYNSDKNFYEELALYKPGEEYYYNKKGEKVVDNPYFQKVHIDAGRDYEMFEGMKDEGGKEDGYGHFPCTKIKLNALDPKLKEDIEEKMNTSGYFDFYELTFADMQLYLNEHPTVVDYDDNDFDWDGDGERPRKINPIKPLFYEIVNYAQLADGWDWGFEPFGYYKIIFYFDC